MPLKFTSKRWAVEPYLAFVATTAWDGICLVLGHILFRKGYSKDNFQKIERILYTIVYLAVLKRPGFIFPPIICPNNSSSLFLTVNSAFKFLVPKTTAFLHGIYSHSPVASNLSTGHFLHFLQKLSRLNCRIGNILMGLQLVFCF